MSLYTLKIHTTADKDIEAGVNFYEKLRKGLGKYFIDAILSDIESLQINA